MTPTRRRAHVEPDSLLRCIVCRREKTAEGNFGFSARDTYQTTCLECKSVYNSMREYVDGRLVAPTAAEVRSAVQQGRWQPQEPSVSYPSPTIDLGTLEAHAPAPSPVRIEREVFKGPHDLYDVEVYDEHSGQVFRRKIGITARGTKRYQDIAKTFGFSFRPVTKAVTYPSKAKAEAAERARVAQVERDPNWVKVAKEAFRPVGQRHVTDVGDLIRPSALKHEAEYGIK